MMQTNLREVDPRKVLLNKEKKVPRASSERISFMERRISWDSAKNTCGRKKLNNNWSSKGKKCGTSCNHIGHKSTCRLSWILKVCLRTLELLNRSRRFKKLLRRKKVMLNRSYKILMNFRKINFGMMISKMKKLTMSMKSRKILIKMLTTNKLILFKTRILKSHLAKILPLKKMMKKKMNQMKRAMKMLFPCLSITIKRRQFSKTLVFLIRKCNNHCNYICILMEDTKLRSGSHSVVSLETNSISFIQELSVILKILNYSTIEVKMKLIKCYLTIKTYLTS